MATFAPERGRSAFDAGGVPCVGPARLRWAAEISGSNESDLAFWGRLRHLMRGFRFLSLRQLVSPIKVSAGQLLHLFGDLFAQ